MEGRDTTNVDGPTEDLQSELSLELESKICQLLSRDQQPNNPFYIWQWL